MPKRDAELLVEDMLDALRKIDLYTAGMDHSSFLQDEKTVDAVVRNLEVLGEAARQIPDAFAARHPDVPWRKVTGLRNRIVHDYFGLDLEIIWQIVRNDLPPLKATLEKIS
jgi:uncharacterized protein with HEPN domain